ncbi:MAG: prolipoprotein diacylglyceryl transferase [Acidobacteria bacterium]|nr:prolipoprotein diacylglyceryl transferase [Acidobacteriota bacterium]MBI3655580.1 prolipoprotein diacylglyceryl transferase [Acidobacteriota bacterium]
MYPKLLDLGPIALNTYGLLLALAFLSGLWLTGRFGRQDGVAEDTIWNIGLLITVCGLVGSKLLMLLTEWDFYKKYPSAIFSLSTLKSGGVYYGGLLLSLAACAWYFNYKRLPVWKIADLFAPGVTLGHAIGRVGCFMAGCCFGQETGAPWAVVFTSALAHEQTGVPLGRALHPTQLYEAAAEALIFSILLWMRRRKTFDGQVVLIYLLLYAITRFSIEYFRADDRGTVFGGLLSTSQFISWLIFPAAIIGLIVRSRFRRSPAAVPS